SVVTYQGVQYQIIQPHTSQVGWEPPMTPALWNRTQGGMSGGYAPQQPSNGNTTPNFNNIQHSGSQLPTYVQPELLQQTPLEKKQEGGLQGLLHNQTAQIVGGVLLGAAVLGGGAFAAHEFHQSHTEHQKEESWIQKVTLEQQQAQAQGSPVYWAFANGKNVPPGAIQVGTDSDGGPLYAARAYYENSVQVGKCRNGSGCSIAYGGKECGVEKYQVLCGNPQALKWVQVNGTFNHQAMNVRAISAGQDKDGSPLFVAVADVNGSQPGKAGINLNGMNYAYGGKEVGHPTYRVAVL
ncbi:hypothetical protein HDU76_005973, partial [Blyttiomyces sp. JEL0837]